MSRLLSGCSATRFITTVLLVDVVLVCATAYVEIFFHVKFYREGYLMTWLSFAQLALSALLTWMTFKTYNLPVQWPRTLGQFKDVLSSGRIWLVFSLGFAFLALDELLMIHEVTDKLIHVIFQLEETAATDRIDDYLVLIYALLGLLVLWLARKELWRYRAVFPLLILGIVATFSMIGLDILTSENETIQAYFDRQPDLNLQFYHAIRALSPPGFQAHFSLPETGKFVYNLLVLFEEGAKLIAGGFLVSTFFKCYDIARQKTQTPSI